MKQKVTKEPHLKFAVLACDIALFTIKDNQLLVRIAAVHRPPLFPNTKGLPGGLILPEETADDSALRLINSKGQITSPIYLEQLYTFSALERDPRGRVVAVGYLGLVDWTSLSEEEQNSTEASWLTINEATKLAYDHDEILAVALKRLASRAKYTTLLKNLLPKEFTLSELENVYESVLRADLDKRNFRKKILKQEVVTALCKKKAHGAHRPAELYKFTDKKVIEVEMV